jgi:hypothetical protein
MQAVIADTMKPFGENVLHHAPDKDHGWNIFLCALPRLMIVIPIAHPLTIVADYPPQRDRWAHDVFGQVVGEAFPSCGHFPLLSVGDEALTISPPQRINRVPYLLGPHPFLDHREEIILPFLV